MMEATLLIESVRIPRFAEISGYTEKAVERKIESGVWMEGYEWHLTPAGERTIYIPGYQRWVKRLPRVKVEI